MLSYESKRHFKTPSNKIKFQRASCCMRGTNTTETKNFSTENKTAQRMCVQKKLIMVTLSNLR